MYHCMLKNYTPPKFSDLILLYQKSPPYQSEKNLVQIFAAQHLLNDLLVEFKHLLRGQCSINLSAIQNEKLKLNEFVFTYELLARLDFSTFYKMLELHEQIQNALELLNSCIEQAIHSGLKISMGVFSMDAGNVIIAVCKKA